MAIAAVVVGWRLSEGPIRISFLTPYLQESVLLLPEGWAISIGETYFDWDGETASLRIRTEDVGFINSASQKVLSVPQAAFTVHGDALMAGRIEPRDLTTSGLRLVLTRGEDNSWRLGTSAGDAQSQEEGDQTDRSVARLAADLFGEPGKEEGHSGILGRVDLFTLRDSAVSVVDQPNGRIYQIDARRLSLQGTVAGVSLKADADVSTRELVVPLTASMIYRPDVQELAGNVRFSNLGIKQAVTSLDGPAALAGLDFPVSGSAGFRVSPDGGLAPMRLELEAGEGLFDLSGILQDPLPVRSASLSGEFNPDDISLKVESLTYDAGDFQATATGVLQMSEAGPDIELRIGSDQVPIVRVPAYWPVGDAPATRDWLKQNVTGGTANDVLVELRITPDLAKDDIPARDTINVDFEFEGGEVRLPEPFDPITNATGKLHLTGQEMALSLKGGELGGLSLSDGILTISDSDESPVVLNASFASDGTIAETVDAVIRGQAAETYADLAPLFGVGGSAAVRAEISIPLSKTEDLLPASFAATANLSDVIADGLLGDLSFRAPQMTVKIDPAAAEIQGTVSIGDSRLDLQWLERFRNNEEARREIGFNGLVALQDLAQAGLDLSSMASGVTAAAGFVRFARNGDVEGEVRANLEGTGIQTQAIPWQKGAAKPGIFQSRFRKQVSGPILLKGLKLEADGLVVQGDLGVSESGRLLEARLERLDVAGTTLSLVARQPAGESRWQARLAGRRLDLRPWRHLLDGDEDQSTPLENAEVELELAELVVSDDVVISQASGNLMLRTPNPTGELVGLVNGTARVSAVASQDRAGWRFTLESADAGSVLSALGLGSSIRKGRMNVHGVEAEDGSVSGLATIEDFTLTETPALARLISLASFTGIGEALSGRGLSFSRAEIPFTYAGDRIAISKARMAGPSVGITAEGVYQFDSDQLRFVGNLIPAYSISQVLGKIPLLGPILGGDQGLFGVTYVVEGPSAQPSVTVNPLSALAPGILRRMFLEPVERREIQLPSADEVQNEK